MIIDWQGEECILAIDNNITELRRYQDELRHLERMQLVGEMAAGLGHELRNPMTAVRGFLQYYSQKKDLLPYKESFNIMIDELDRANSIISEFLNLAKDKNSDLKKQQLNEIIQSIYPLFQIEALKNNKNIHLDLSPLPELELDEKEIRQLLHNLVRNGLEAIAPGGDVTVKTFTDGKEAILAVHNNGPVIQPDVLRKIGTPFFTTKDYGTGLGLAVCYSIARRHNAKIDIETSQTGTTFYVRFLTHGEGSRMSSSH